MAAKASSPLTRASGRYRSFVDLSAAAFTREQVLRLTGVSRRRLTYWLEKGIVSADVRAPRGRGQVHLWSFTNLLEVRVALWLRERVSLQLLGKVVGALRQRGYVSPLAELRVDVIESGNKSPRIVVQASDGNWEEPITGQLVMRLVLPLGQFRDELSGAIEADRRRQRMPGKIIRQRGRLGSAPVFAGTRIPVAAVKRLQGLGWSTERILAEYPGLTAKDVGAAHGAAQAG